MLPGFLHRLLAEIRYLVEKPKYKKTLGTKTFRIHTPPAKANCVAWLGGKNFCLFFFVFVFLGFFLSIPRGLRDLSSPTRDRIQAPQQWKCGVLTTGPPGNSQEFHF